MPRTLRPFAPRFAPACVLGLLGAFGGSSCASEEAPGRPSIVLISIDTLRADHMGVYGYERDTTPNLDRFASECLIFERAFAPSAWTLISHMTMLTGLYPNQHGVMSRESALSPELPLLAEELSRVGYRTAGLYCEGWIHERYGFGRGFDEFLAHADAEEAGEHLEETLARLDPASGRPFFLFLHLFDVHCGPLSKTEPGPIYDCPPPYDDWFLEGARERMPDLPEGQVWRTPGAFPPEVLEGLTALYDGGIRYVDETLGGWLASWREAGWLDDALVIVTADHGESLGQRGLGIADHGGPYQEGLRVPLLVRPPGGAAGERVGATVHLADVVPTALAAVGLDTEAMPGLPLLGPLPDGREVYALTDTFEVIVRWPEKLARFGKPHEFIRADLVEDPGELLKVTYPQADFEARREALLDELSRGRTFAPPIPVDVPPADSSKLNDIGYGGDGP